MRIQKKYYKPRYKVDFNLVENIPIKEVLTNNGIKVRGNRCFCPDPNCSDSSSKNMGASIYKNSIVKCFVCGESYTSLSLIELFEFGRKIKITSAEDMDKLAEALIREGFSYAVTDYTITEEKKEKISDTHMPVVDMGNGEKLPMWQILGFYKTPYQPYSAISSPDNFEYSLGNPLEKVTPDKKDVSAICLTKAYDKLLDLEKRITDIKSHYEAGDEEILNYLWKMFAAATKFTKVLYDRCEGYMEGKIPLRDMKLIETYEYGGDAVKEALFPLYKEISFSIDDIDTSSEEMDLSAEEEIERD